MRSPQRWFWLLMKVLWSIINVHATRLKLIFKISSMRYCHSRKPIFASSMSRARFNVTDSGFLLNENSYSSQYRELNQFCFGGKKVIESVDTSSLFSLNEDMERIMLILAKRGWSLGCLNGYNSYRNQFYVIQVLNYLFEESLDANLALYFFKWSECRTGSMHTIWTVCRMIHIFVLGNMNYRAVDLIRQLVKNYAEPESCEFLLQVLYETCSGTEILETVFSMVVNNYANEGRMNVALGLLTCGMKRLNIFPSCWVCHTLLRALLRFNQLDFAWDLLEVMRTRGQVLLPSSINLFIHKYCSEGNLECGLKLFFEMNKYGIQPDVVSYTTIIHTLYKMSYVNEATALLFKMAQLGISPDLVLIGSVVEGHCKMRQIGEAIKILKIFNSSLNIIMYNSFISKLCTDGNMLEASGLFLEMTELGFLPDCISYSTMIQGYCKLKDINRANLYFGKMFKSGITPSTITYTLLIDAYCKSGDTEIAEYMSQAMLSECQSPDVVTYNTLMDGYGKKRNLQKVFGVLDMINCSDVSPDVVTYNTLIHSLVARGLVNPAKEILLELLKRGFSLDVVSFTDVISGLSKEGNFEEAFFVWSCMSEYGVKPDVVTCTALLSGYCRKHQMEQASALFGKMLDAGINPDRILYTTMIYGFCRVGDMDNACNLMCMMIKNDIFPNDITHREFVHGFRKKCVRNPVLVAARTLKEIFFRYG